MSVSNSTELPRRVVWQPLPGSQTLALSAPVNHVFFEGTRGPGKTDAQLMRFRRLVGKGYGRFWRGIIFDRQYRNLDDIISKSQRWFSNFGDGASYSGAGGGGRWRWPTGEELLFRHIKKPKDYWLYHGHEYPFIGWNEITKYPTAELYEAMMSCNRTSFLPANYPLPDGSLLPEIPLEVFLTGNPFGPGHTWVKRRFVDVAKPGEVVRKSINVFNPRTQEREDVVKTQVRIFGSYKENVHLTPEYVAELESISDPNKRRAWLWGDWDVVSGGMFDDVWDANVHVKPRFKIPKSWKKIDRTFDWGSSHPFWVGWWAEASGEEVILPSGEKFAPERGSLVLFHEWYGTVEIGSNRGLKMSATDVADGIIEVENKLKTGKWVLRNVSPGPADNQIRNVTDVGQETIEKKMTDRGIRWMPSDKSDGSRINGAQLFRDRLQAAYPGREGPAVYFMSHCTGAIETIYCLPRDEDNMDDVDTDAEDHPWDGVRYRVLASDGRLAKNLSVNRNR